MSNSWYMTRITHYSFNIQIQLLLTPYSFNIQIQLEPTHDTTL